MDITKTKNFYKEFNEFNPALLLGLLIISLGLYSINWIYLRNKEFENLDKFAPDSNRGAIILMILPFSWFFITFITKKLIFTGNNLFLEILNIVGWGIITFLILKYLLDFSISFGRITQTQGVYWFIGFLLTIIGIYSFFFHIKYLSFLIISIFILLPALQSELNIHYKHITIKKERNTFYN